jgi:hypothetical protein
MTNHKELQAVFEQLREILRKYESRLVVLHDKPGNYYLNTPYSQKFKKVMSFAAAIINKNYVSFHFVPVYGCPDMADGLSPELKARMQGKGCFNFKKVDKELFKELRQLTKVGYERFKKAGFIEEDRKRSQLHKKSL